MTYVVDKKWPKQDCIYCCQESLQYIDGLTVEQAQNFAGGTSYNYEPNGSDEAKLCEAIELCAATNGLDLRELKSQEAGCNVTRSLGHQKIELRIQEE